MQLPLERTGSCLRSVLGDIESSGWFRMVGRERGCRVRAFCKGMPKMPKPAEIRTRSRTIPVLSVSPVQDDHDELERLLSRPQWNVYKATGLSAAMVLLRRTRVALVVCARDLLPGSWKDMMDHLVLLPEPPYLIVTSRHADERLWAEALNLGAYDVAKPFDATEVLRVNSLAWQHWQNLHESPINRSERTMAATGT